MIGQAFDVAWQAHRNQKDLAGRPYILHVVRVMESVEHESEDARVVALLHDVLEDGYFSYQYLAGRFGTEISGAVLTLSHVAGMNYQEYIRSILGSGSTLAIAVKIADLKDNLDLSRLREVKPSDLRRAAKYEAALSILALREGDGAEKSDTPPRP